MSHGCYRHNDRLVRNVEFVQLSDLDVVYAAFRRLDDDTQRRYLPSRLERFGKEDWVLRLYLKDDECGSKGEEEYGNK